MLPHVHMAVLRAAVEETRRMYEERLEAIKRDYEARAKRYFSDMYWQDWDCCRLGLLQ